jgi:hypothetical protein
MSAPRISPPGALVTPVPALELVEAEVGTGTPALLVTRGALAGGSAPSLLFDSQSGAAAFANHGTNALRGFRMTSAVNTINGRNAASFGIPVGRRWDAVPVAAARRFRRYELEALLLRDALPAGVRFSLGLRKSIFHLGDFTNQTGIEVFSDPAIFAGRWGVRSLLVANGALSAPIDSGVAATVLTLARIVYDEGAAEPQCYLELNGVRVATLAGYAALPTPSTHNFYFSQGTNPGSAAGATDWVLQPRYRMWELNP